VRVNSPILKPGPATARWLAAHLTRFLPPVNGWVSALYHYDPDGDGVGRLTFVEPMATVGFLDDPDEETEVALKTPEEYFTADDYSTTYVMKPDHSDGVYVSIDGFGEFPGPDE